MTYRVDPLFHAPDAGSTGVATDADADAIQAAPETLQRLDALAGELSGTLAAARWSEALGARVLQLMEILGAAMHRRDGESMREAGDDSLAAIERRHIEHVLRRSGWRINGKGNAAEQLNLHPNTLRFRMKKLGIARPARGARPERGARRNHVTSPG
jgi:DNA-binding NtrC family response regulator